MSRVIANHIDHATVVEQNRQSWNAAVTAHSSHFGDVAAFFRGGGTTLFPEEVGLLGPLTGKSVAHLLCGPGHDTLSLARLGAAVVGIDVSDQAIARAINLAQRVGMAASFIRADAYEWLEDASNAGRCDVAFASYGVLCWLDDLERFASGVARILRERGRLVLVDFHPVALMYDRRLQRAHPYSSHGSVLIDPKGIGDYVGRSGDVMVPWGFVAGIRDFENPVPCNVFRWSLSELWEGLRGSGLMIQRFEELEFVNGYRMFDTLLPEPKERRWAFPPGATPFPMMFALEASL